MILVASWATTSTFGISPVRPGCTQDFAAILTSSGRTSFLGVEKAMVSAAVASFLGFTATS